MPGGKNADAPLMLPARLRPPCLSWAGYAVFIWSVAYMLPHLYWAVGGTVGMSLLRPTVFELPQWKMINGVASAILSGAGLLGLAFVYLRRGRFLRRGLLAIALVGCSIATSHGVYGIIYRTLQLAGVVELEAGPFSVKGQAYVLWDLLLLEPWFTIEGILLGAAGWCYLEGARERRSWLALCAAGVGVGLTSGLVGVRFA